MGRVQGRDEEGLGRRGVYRVQLLRMIRVYVKNE